MASLEMKGPFSLSEAEIDTQITKKSPGNYALGYSKDGKFRVKYVGRSDDDLKVRLKIWAGEYKRFKYSYATSPKAAFEKECQNFHDFGGAAKLDNSIHPDRPDGTGWKCPVCNNFD